MGKTIDILQFIPVGKENAITRCELVGRTGLPDRVVRKLIEDARLDHAIVNNSDGTDYYITENPMEAKLYKNQEIHRIKSQLKKIKALDKVIAKGSHV